MLLRGTLDICVLSILRAPSHAYGVVQALHEAGFTGVGYGTVYPLVTRPRKLGLVDQDVRPGSGGPARHVRTLNQHGHHRVASLLDGSSRSPTEEGCDV